MPTLLKNIETCKATRELAAKAMADVLLGSDLSESQFCEKVAQRLYQAPNWDQGWYSPPPKGLGTLFAPESNPARLAYDNLRKEEFWPQNSNIFSKDSLGYIYASPVNKQAGIIGDIGLTIYRGSDQKIISHLKSCLEIAEKTAEHAQVGMELRDVFNYCQDLMGQKGLNSRRMLTYTDKTKNNIGHTVPWSHQEQTTEELEIIKGNNFEKLKNLISSKRVHLNAEENFKIPATVAFTVEPRMEGKNSPLASFHMIVTFKNGKKEILANFKPVFAALGMDNFITSKYD